MPQGSRDPIVSSIVHVREPRADAVIPTGEVSLSFDRTLEAAQVQVLLEVAAQLEVWFVDERGQTIAGGGHTIDVCAGDPVYVRATLISPAGDTLIGQVRQPERLALQLRHGERTQSLALSPGGSYFEASIPVSEGSVTLSVSAAYPGYFNFHSRMLTLRGRECPIRTLDLAAGPWSARVTELQAAPPLVLVPRADGIPVPPGELTAWTLERVDAGRLRIDVERSTEGWHLRPRQTWALACFTPTGRIPVELTFRSANPREPLLTRTVVLEVVDVGFWHRCGGLIIGVALLLLFLVWLFGVLRKRRFCGGSEIVYQRKTSVSTTPGITEKLPRGFASRYLVPFVPERTSINGLTFEAGGRCGYIMIPPHVQTEEMYVAGERLDDPKRRAVRLTQGDTLEIRRARQREIYTYNLHRST
jgi:hypothetical protein